LTDDEKTAINLSAGMDKSSWEAGEIMAKAHYKYLEIQKRSEQFIKMFNNHYLKYGQLIPECDLDLNFSKFILLVVEKRMKVKDAVNKMKKTDYTDSKKRGKMIINQLLTMRLSELTEHTDLYNLIMDFDRWNNFRVLPKEIQEPSAFKRRNKVRDLKQLELSLTIPNISASHILKKYSWSSDKIPENMGYGVLMIRDAKKPSYNVFTYKKADIKKVSEITSMFIYLFDDHKDAKEFAELLHTFPNKGDRDCKHGLKFWPIFRVLSRRANNYNELNNIAPSRKNQEEAFHCHDIQIYRTDKRLKEEAKFGKPFRRKKVRKDVKD
tara:strand:- start:1452 stop:2423 length:972 start_codon:yes stop_codon:yes gene_type:complete